MDGGNPPSQKVAGLCHYQHTRAPDLGRHLLLFL